MKQVVILGAGISGLTAGWYLHKKWGSQIQLTLLEKEDRVGGWIRTLQQNGFLFEQGPRGFRPSGKGRATLDLIRDLGLESKLIASNRLAKNRYILLEGSLHRLSLKLLLRHGFLRGCLQDWKTPACSLEDETIARFFERRFNRSFTETFVDPVVKGIYGGDISQLSCRSCFPTFWNWEKQKGSLLRGFFSSPKAKGPALYSFQEGMELLPKTLAAKLPASIMLSTPVQKVEKKDKTFFIHLKHKTIKADSLISALPSYALAQIFDPLRPLLDIPFVTLSLVHLGWHGEVLKKKGYGFLVPDRKSFYSFDGADFVESEAIRRRAEGEDNLDTLSRPSTKPDGKRCSSKPKNFCGRALVPTKEKQALLGMVWDSSVFPTQNQGKQTRLTLMISGSHSPAELNEIALQSSASYLQITQPPDEILTHVAHRAIPQYTLNHFQRLRQLEAALPKEMCIVGNSFYGVGVNDCIVTSAQPQKFLQF